MILVFVALLLAAEFREALPVGKSSVPATWQLPLPVYLIVAVIWGIIFTSTDVYNPREVLHLSKEIVKVVEGTAVAGLIFSGVLYFTYRQISRLEIIYFLAIYLILIIIHRVAVRVLFKITGSNRYDSAPCVDCGNRADRAGNWMYSQRKRLDGVGTGWLCGRGRRSDG